MRSQANEHCAEKLSRDFTFTLCIMSKYNNTTRYLVIESYLSPRTISLSYSILTLSKNSFRIFFLEKSQQYVDEQKKRKLGKQTKK